jgi:hypothetical protein
MIPSTLQVLLNPAERYALGKTFRTQLKRVLGIGFVLAALVTLTCVWQLSVASPQGRASGIRYLVMLQLGIAAILMLTLHLEGLKRKQGNTVVFKVVRAVNSSLRAIQLSAQELHKKSGRSVMQDMAHVVERYILTAKSDFSNLISGSTRVRGMDPLDLLYQCAVFAATRALKVQPAIADVWLDASEGASKAGRAPSRWMSYGLVRSKEQGGDRDDSELVNLLRPRENGKSEMILRLNRAHALLANEAAECTSRELGMKMCIGVPIRRDGRAIGVMWLRYKEQHPVSVVDLNALTAYWESLSPNIEETRVKWAQLAEDVTKDVSKSALRAADVLASKGV